MPDRPPLVPVIVGVVLLTTALTTASQYPWVQSELSAQYRALHRYPSTSPADVIDNHWDSMRQRYGVYVALHEHAAGASLTLPRGMGLSTDQLYGLALLRDVQRPDELGITVDELPPDLEDHVVASGEDRHVGPYTIAVSSQPDELVAVPSADGVLVIDQSLLPETGDDDG